MVGTLLDVLDDLARSHGLHTTGAISLRVDDLSQIAGWMRKLRADLPSTLLGEPVTTAVDLLPLTDGVRLATERARVVVRPSGTEPKLKCYLELVSPVADGTEDLAALRDRAGQEMESLRGRSGCVHPELISRSRLNGGCIRPKKPGEVLLPLRSSGRELIGTFNSLVGAGWPTAVRCCVHHHFRCSELGKSSQWGVGEGENVTLDDVVPAIEILTYSDDEGTVNGHAVTRGAYPTIYDACIALTVPYAQQAGGPVLTHAVDTIGPPVEYWLHVHPDGQAVPAQAGSPDIMDPGPSAAEVTTEFPRITDESTPDPAVAQSYAPILTDLPDLSRLRAAPEVAPTPAPVDDAPAEAEVDVIEAALIPQPREQLNGSARSTRAARRHAADGEPGPSRPAVPVAAEEPAPAPAPAAVTPPTPATVIPPEPAAVIPPEPATVIPPEPAAVIPPEPATVIPPEPSAVFRPQPAAAITPTPVAPPLTSVAPSTPTLDDLLATRPAPPEGPAQFGWRATLRRLTGGAVALGPAPDEMQQRSAIAAVQRSLAGPKTVVVINPKGGANKTTATLLIAATFGIHRGGYTLAWDNNETRGTMGWRANQGRHTNTAVDLLRELDRFEDARSARVGDLDNFVRGQGSAQFDVLASDEDAASAASIDASAFNALHRSLSRFYRVMVVDTGNNMRASNWDAAVAAADQVVIVSTIREDTAQSAAWVADALNEKGYQDKVKNAVTILAGPSVRSDPELDRRLQDHFGRLTRVVTHVPFDPALVAGGPINIEQLSTASRDAWLQATALIADGL